MSKITLVRCAEPLPGDSVLAGVRRFLFGLFDGWSRDDRKGWRKLWKRLMALEPGEFATVEFVIPRSSQYHRRHFAIINAVFDAQERFTDFDVFLAWIKVGAAWVVWAAGPKGGVVPIPRSISYAKADQTEFERFHGQVMGFFRGPHAATFLWRHLGDGAHAMMDSILQEFDE